MSGRARACSSPRIAPISVESTSTVRARVPGAALIPASGRPTWATARSMRPCRPSKPFAADSSPRRPLHCRTACRSQLRLRRTPPLAFGRARIRLCPCGLSSGAAKPSSSQSPRGPLRLRGLTTIAAVGVPPSATRAAAPRVGPRRAARAPSPAHRRAHGRSDTDSDALARDSRAPPRGPLARRRGERLPL